MLARASFAHLGSSSTPTAAAASVDRLHERCADPAHRVEDKVAGVAVSLNSLACERGEHLAWVPV